MGPGIVSHPSTLFSLFDVQLRPLKILDIDFHRVDRNWVRVSGVNQDTGVH